MADTSWREGLRGVVVTEQIVIGALIAGAFLFLVTAAVLRSTGVFGADSDETLAWIMNLALVVFLVPDMLARVIVPRMMVAGARRKILAGQWSVPAGPNQAQTVELIERTGDAGRLMGVHNTKTIVSAALIEGVTFFAIIVFLTTGSTFALGMATVLLAVLALHFPTRNGVFDWIENQLQLLEQERAFGNQ